MVKGDLFIFLENMALRFRLKTMDFVNQILSGHFCQYIPGKYNIHIVIHRKFDCIVSVTVQGCGNGKLLLRQTFCFSFQRVFVAID